MLESLFHVKDSLRALFRISRTNVSSVARKNIGTTSKDMMKFNYSKFSTHEHLHHRDMMLVIP